MTLISFVLAQMVMFHTARWSPEGDRLLITRTLDQHQVQAHIFDLQRERLSAITAAALERTEREWQPQPRMPEAIEQSTGTGQAVALRTAAREVYRVLSEEQWAEQPGLSPDGQWIVYEARASPHDILASWIMVVDTSGSNRRRLHEGTDPSWSPDGRSILFKTPIAGELHVATIPATGGTVAVLASGVHPVWSPDGRYIAYMADSGTRADIWIMNVDGTAKRCITCSVQAAPQEPAP